MTEPPERTPLQAKLDVLKPVLKLTKRETAASMTKAVKRISNARRLRRTENVSAGRLDADDDIVTELDAAEDILVALGAFPAVEP
jgi:hypothetical protein